MIPCRTNSIERNTLEDQDIALLQALVEIGMPLRPDELESDDALGMDAAVIRERLIVMADAGYVKLTFSATVRGGSHIYRHVHHQRDLRVAA